MIHAIIATWAFDDEKKREALSRGCPKCGSAQIAGEGRLNQTETCEKCGAEIPPQAVARGKENEHNNG